jgi:two-component system, sensor histidine kinase and response regulator
MHPAAAGSGQEALTALSRARHQGDFFALVLLDLYLPGEDGLTLLEQMKTAAGTAGQPVIGLSSVEGHKVMARCRELAVEACLTKPVAETELLDAILTVLGLSTEKEEQPPTSSPALIDPRGNSLSILLAEDNEVNQVIVQRVLERCGHRVTVVNNGFAVLSTLEKSRFDLILMDVQMPEMDGVKATQAIRLAEQATGTHIPIIALTAHAMPGDRERCLLAGMDAYITKPIKPRTFFAALQEVTG